MRNPSDTLGCKGLQPDPGSPCVAPNSLPIRICKTEADRESSLRLRKPWTVPPSYSKRLKLALANSRLSPPPIATSAPTYLKHHTRAHQRNRIHARKAHPALSNTECTSPPQEDNRYALLTTKSSPSLVAHSSPFSVPTASRSQQRHLNPARILKRSPQHENKLVCYLCSNIIATFTTRPTTSYLLHKSYASHPNSTTFHLVSRTLVYRHQSASIVPPCHHAKCKSTSHTQKATTARKHATAAK